jgi:endonuclease G
MGKRILFLSLSLLLYSFNVFAAFESCEFFFPSKQIPTTQIKGRDLCFSEFAVFYSPADKKPVYVVEKLNSSSLSKKSPERTNQFYEEARLPNSERAFLEDYVNSGYDRGHNAPAADMRTKEGMYQSFSLANIMPQASENNRGVWAKSVEKPARQFVMRSYGDIYIYTGSFGNSGNIGIHKIIIPTYIFKLIYNSKSKKKLVFLVKNNNEISKPELITYDELKKLTKINFNLD